LLPLEVTLYKKNRLKINVIIRIKVKEEEKLYMIISKYLFLLYSG